MVLMLIQNILILRLVLFVLKICFYYRYIYIFFKGTYNLASVLNITTQNVCMYIQLLIYTADYFIKTCDKHTRAVWYVPVLDDRWRHWCKTCIPSYDAILILFHLNMSEVWFKRCLHNVDIRILRQWRHLSSNTCTYHMSINKLWCPLIKLFATFILVLRMMIIKTVHSVEHVYVHQFLIRHNLLENMFKFHWIFQVDRMVKYGCVIMCYIYKSLKDKHCKVYL